jgi:preprotein translocase subunit SecD
MAMTLLTAMVALHGLSDATAPLRVELANANMAIEDIGHCAEHASRPAWDERYHRAMAGLFQTFRRAEQIVGSDADYIELAASRDARKAPKCSEGFVEKSEARAISELSKAAQMVDGMERRLARGLWIGLFPICDQTARYAEIKPNWRSEKVVAVALAEDRIEELRQYSAKFVSGSLTRRIAVRLNGMVISTPSVNEELTGIELSAADERSLEAIRTEARSTCKID